MSYVYINITANRVVRNFDGLQLAEIAAPATPASGWGHLYVKSDGKIYFKNDAGTETDLVAGGAGAVTSVSGTANRITSTGGVTPVIDIAATYVGQTSITTLGTIATGTWSATAISAAKGGTGIDTSGSTGYPSLTTGTWSIKTATELKEELDLVGLVQAPTELTAQTGSIAATTVYTTPAADGYYRISITGTITTAAGTSLDLAAIAKWTEATDNVVKTFPSNNINNLNRTNTNATGVAIAFSVMAHVKASTAIQYQTSFSFSGGAPEYNLHITVEKLYN